MRGDGLIEDLPARPRLARLPLGDEGARDALQGRVPATRVLPPGGHRGAYGRTTNTEHVEVSGFRISPPVRWVKPPLEACPRSYPASHLVGVGDIRRLTPRVVPVIQSLAASPVPKLVPEIQLPLHLLPPLCSSIVHFISIQYGIRPHLRRQARGPRMCPTSGPVDPGGFRVFFTIAIDKVILIER